MPDIRRWTVTEPYLNIHCGLGEAPYYEAERNTLRFVDIKNKRLHSVDLNVGPESLKTLELDMSVGVTADIEGVDSSKKILVGAKNGVYILDRETGGFGLLKKYYDDEEKDERLRSNDGAVDTDGRFWVTTMNDFWVGEPQAEGTLFRIGNDLTRTTMRTSLTIPNGVGWSRDKKTQYFTHSTEKRIIAFDYDAATGDLSNERTFWEHDGDGDPDGFKMDEEGNIWQAIYGESRVLKISPGGNIIGEIKYPTRCITCPCFVGTELWVTSADEEDETNVESKKYGGGVFKVDVGVRGLQDYKFKLST
ncbi:Calcium-dependent phosphotriesterase [Glarea lozoyensis ATCC 20868]|uniref:Calcium-dependent phosphotriesterase n=1 Tax=Glarea lozoyensis (strain ATCC 20868 / MF5171) TaxID=1116229 RepID=S3CX13_GLAL2|nr:Calcium-dependent phosphotriesterase [Glarea lozoyensis ATCC 20868]EPE30175.1 Calcium-dependent phosphotriesterase [Glarea lozoyensis ATCC 20868]